MDTSSVTSIMSESSSVNPYSAACGDEIRWRCVYTSQAKYSTIIFYKNHYIFSWQKNLQLNIFNSSKYVIYTKNLIRQQYVLSLASGYDRRENLTLLRIILFLEYKMIYAKNCN